MFIFQTKSKNGNSQVKCSELSGGSAPMSSSTLVIFSVQKRAMMIHLFTNWLIVDYFVTGFGPPLSPQTRRRIVIELSKSYSFAVIPPICVLHLMDISLTVWLIGVKAQDQNINNTPRLNTHKMGGCTVALCTASIVICGTWLATSSSKGGVMTKNLFWKSIRSFEKVYYKVWLTLLQSATALFITKCDEGVLQSATAILLQNVIQVITKCDRYYIVQRLLQRATVQRDFICNPMCSSTFANVHLILYLIVGQRVFGCFVQGNSVINSRDLFSC